MLLVALLLLVAGVQSETFTSLVHLKRAIYSQQDLVDLVDEYIQLETARLSTLRRFAIDMQNESEQLVRDNLERHLANPVNAFLIIKKLYETKTQLDKILNWQANTNLEEYTKKSQTLQSYLPSKEDIDGSIHAMLRLQDTYNLNTTQLTDGNLGLMDRSFEAPSLTADECVEVGRTAFFADDFYHAIMWFQAALDKYDSTIEGPNDSDSLQRKIGNALDFLNFSLFKQGNVERALSAVERWLSIDPQANPGRENRVWYYKMLNESGATYDPSNLPPLRNEQIRTGYHDSDMFKLYEQLCQEKTPPEYILNTSQLNCYIKRVPISYVPAYIEVLMDEPRVVYYHHVFTDSDIKYIQEVSMPKLDRSGVFAKDSITPAGGVKTSTRISKSAWLNDLEFPRIQSLSTRISRLTGLTLTWAEALQVLNYGIGGHYEPHCDFARSDNPDVFAQGAGNRIATFISYLTDVELGGGTAFPRLGITVKPVKGGAAFWYNILPDGSLDERTLHGACPVLAGYKWVANKWFHESGNEFTRPCGLKPNLQ